MKHIITTIFVIAIFYQASTLSLVTHLKTFEEIKHSLKVLGSIKGNLTVNQIAKFKRGEVDTLNRLRALHGCAPVKLDNKITKYSQKYAQKLFDEKKFEHSGGPYGENLWAIGGYPFFNYQKGAAVMAWYSQIAGYDFDKGEATSQDKVIGHFTAEIWNSVKKVGFGFAAGVKDEDRPEEGTILYVVANFYPAPNVQGQYTKHVPRPL